MPFRKGFYYIDKQAFKKYLAMLARRLGSSLRWVKWS